MLTAVLALTSMSIYAEQSLPEMKTMANNHINEKMSTLKTAQSCINNSETKEAFKVCKYDLHESMKMQKQEAMEQKKTDK